MDGMDVVMFFWSILFSVVGLFMVCLQKRGLVKPNIHMETRSFLGVKKRHVSGMCGGIFVYTGAFAGFVTLRRYSALWPWVYAGAVAGIYILIQIIYQKRKSKKRSRK